MLNPIELSACLLEDPRIYQIYQVAGGFFGARIKAFRDYLSFSKVNKIFDIGCGPGHIVKYLPPEIEYVGFDTNENCIEWARKNLNEKGTFVASEFDVTARDRFGSPDLIMLNGVIHHLDDVLVHKVLSDAREVLTEKGVFFALDGCYVKGQNMIANYLLKNDRGKYVRDQKGYFELCSRYFNEPEVIVRNDLSWVPYTFAITKGIK